MSPLGHNRKSGVAAAAALQITRLPAGRRGWSGSALTVWLGFIPTEAWAEHDRAMEEECEECDGGSRHLSFRLSGWVSLELSDASLRTCFSLVRSRKPRIMPSVRNSETWPAAEYG